MNRDRIVEILETYRPGEGLEADPEVRQALDLAETDAELHSLRREIERFDDDMRHQLRSIPVPADLQAKILAAMKAHKVVAFPDAPAAERPMPVSSNAWMRWIHPAVFGAAAAIVILLALTFTFWQRPQAVPAPLTLGSPHADNPALAAKAELMQTAHALYSSLRPAFKSSEGAEVVNYLRNQGATLPSILPGGTGWDQSFACDIVRINNTEVTIICFKAPDNSRSMHLFTFPRSAFPDLQLTERPQIHNNEAGCCATWGTEDNVHVLFSDKGEDNLRQILRI